ncbi:MAG: sodium:solute symporter [Saprospiraceae bacterium]|nr:sodium:solute symporter [Saprospiraceae bacterium]
MSVDLQSLDISVIALYFIVVFGIAWWASRREKESASASADYFLAGRNTGWFVIGASIFASNIGSEHLIGLTGSGFAEGLPVAQFEIYAGVILLLLGWVFVPIYLRTGVYTMPEFLERRYSENTRMYLSVISIIAYVLTKISVTIYAGGVVFEVIGVDFWVGVILLVIATGVYTVFGGLKAVIYTDMIQMFVLIGGGVAVTLSGLYMLGGVNEMIAIVNQGAEMNHQESFFNLWRDSDNPNYPWTGVLFGAPILGIWYWCTDQFIVQRVLAAKDISNARRGTIFAGFLKILPLFIFVFPGVVAFALVQKGMLTVDQPNSTLPAMVREVLPVGLRGLMIAGIFAALMSSLSSVFNSCSTLITWDLYKKFNPQASERKLVLVGQMTTVTLVVLGLAWIPFMGIFSDQLFLYLQSVQAYIAPPIAAVFLFGVFNRRINSYGAMACLLTGFFLGLFMFALQIKKDLLNGVILDFASINFLHFALLLFVICSLVLVTVSWMTPAPSIIKVESVTYHNFQEIKSGSSSLQVALSVLLLGAIFALWIIFS